MIMILITLKLNDLFSTLPAPCYTTVKNHISIIHSFVWEHKPGKHGFCDGYMYNNTKLKNPVVENIEHLAC